MHAMGGIVVTGIIRLTLLKQIQKQQRKGKILVHPLDFSRMLPLLSCITNCFGMRTRYVMKRRGANK